MFPKIHILPIALLVLCSAAHPDGDDDDEGFGK